jgi:hypothetical protein
MIKPKFTKADIEKYAKQQMKKMNTIIIARLQYVGETFVNNARSKTPEEGGFYDQTGNLRSSIGYVILKDGKKMNFSGFEKLKNGSLGQQRGQHLIKELSKNYPTGFVLICVAGMEYAAAVESKGKDVLTGSSIIAKKDLQAAFKKQYRG